MTRLTRKLMISILTVVLSISALGTTTFAWFTLTNVATVESFSANIVSETGIEVSLDGETWYNSLTETLIQEYITAKYGTFAFNHITSADGQIMRSLGTTSLPNVTAGSGHLELILFFRSENVEQLAWTAATLGGTGLTWRSDVDYTDSKGVSVLAGTDVSLSPADAMRISVLSPVDVTAGPDADPLTFDPSIVVYENPISGTNTVLGGLAGVDLSNGGVGANGGLNYYYVKTGSLPFGTDSVTVVGTETAITSDPLNPFIVLNLTATNSEPVVYPSDTYYFTDTLGKTVNYNAAFGGYIVINIWFEGYDAEGFNSLLGGEITVGLEFKGFPFEA
ncbi:MAG: hypothetical protein V3569_04775 [Acholeplasmataceae bacterium]|nr:hypothetical protein [Acholeplasmataceae bacterium]